MTKVKVLPVTLSLVEMRVVFLSLALASFVVAFSFEGSQLLVGTVVNLVLFSAAVLLPGRFFLPLIFLPSLAVLSRGLLFGSLTPFLLYFSPFIWLGNLSLILVFKKTFNFFGYFFSIFLSALVKFLLLSGFANLLFRFHIVPRLFLTAMGINQLITASLGGILSLFVLKFSYGRVQSRP